MIRLLIFFSLLLTMSTNTPFEEENTLIYVGDPMCSWCYGFGPEIDKIEKSLPNNVNFQIILGGLRPNGTQDMTELGDFLKEHWVEIHERTGQPFSYDILQQSDFIYNTEPACRAIVTARKMDESKAMPFFHKIQTAFYEKNLNTGNTKTYTDIAANLEMDKAAFEQLFLSEDMKKATMIDFEVAGQMGINSFPSVVLKKGEEYFLVGKGYAKAETILETVSRIMNN